MSTLRPLIADVDAEIREYPLVAGDGLRLGLTRFRRGHGERSIVLLHGMAVSTDMFVMPEHDNFVESLLDSGWSDVWSIDWRASSRLPYNTDNCTYNVDDVALYDLPAAFAVIREHIGERPLAAFAHCVGALALGMAVSAQLLGPLAAVVANSTFLTPNLPEQSRLKLTVLPGVLRRLLAKGHIPIEIAEVGLISKYTPLFAVAAAGSTCNDPTCQLVNFAWGAGDSPLYEHRNLHPITHNRLRELFGPAPLSFYAHLRKMANEHAVVRNDVADARYDALPRSALDALSEWRTPMLLLEGVAQRIWTGSHALCRDYLNHQHPRLDVTLLEIPGYGHFDTIIGRAAALDVFPRVISWLDERVPSR